jgi:hypothetical protein
MAETQLTLEERISSCRELLDIFKSERRLLLSRATLKPSDILQTLKLKLRLVNLVSDGLGNHPAHTVPEPAAANKTQRRKQTRRLAELLEKLLVIERENQQLLRNLIGKAGPTARTDTDARNPAGRQPSEKSAQLQPLVDRLHRIGGPQPKAGSAVNRENVLNDSC